MSHVANIPAEEAKAREDARVPRSRKDSHRKESSSPPQSKRPKEPCGQRIISFLTFICMKKISEHVSREKFSTLGRPRLTHSSPLVTLRVFSHSPEETQASFLVTISKKEIPTAVKRNLMRRRYKHALRGALAHFPARGTIQCVVKKSALSASFQEIQQDIEQMIKKI